MTLVKGSWHCCQQRFHWYPSHNIHPSLGPCHTIPVKVDLSPSCYRCTMSHLVAVRSMNNSLCPHLVPDVHCTLGFLGLVTPEQCTLAHLVSDPRRMFLSHTHLTVVCGRCCGWVGDAFARSHFTIASKAKPNFIANTMMKAEWTEMLGVTIVRSMSCNNQMLFIHCHSSDLGGAPEGNVRTLSWHNHDW